MIRKTLFLSAALGFSLALGCDGDGMDDDASGGGTGGTDGVPAPYAGKSNPVEGDSAAISAGMSNYMTLCASCHGETGAGDGPSGNSTPPATNFTAKMEPDDFMLYTISEGVEGTSMVSYKSTLDESEIWEVVAFIRTLQ